VLAFTGILTLCRSSALRAVRRLQLSRQHRSVLGCKLVLYTLMCTGASSCSACSCIVRMDRERSYVALSKSVCLAHSIAGSLSTSGAPLSGVAVVGVLHSLVAHCASLVNRLVSIRALPCKECSGTGRHMHASIIIIINPCKPYLTASAPRLTHWGGGK
jgi:hypothetical protein